MTSSDLSLFAIEATSELGENIARQLGVQLSKHEERDFADGEHKIRPVEPVRGRDVYVIQSLYPDEQQSVNDKLVRLLLFIGAVHDAGAGRVTAVIPYLAYARKDRRTEPRDPVSTRYLAQMIEAVGTDSVIALDVHNPAAYENSFRIHTEHLEAAGILAARVAEEIPAGERVTVISPDAGGLKRAGRFQETLGKAMGREVGIGFVDKSRDGGNLTAGSVHADVGGATAVIVDDMISTGGTLALAARSARELGARRVIAAASHGLFVGDAANVLGSDAIDRVFITDSAPPLSLPPDLIRRKLAVLSCAPMFAGAMRRLSG